jgi:hypothetical protein
LTTVCDVDVSGLIGWEIEGDGRVRFMTVELKYASRISKGSSLSSTRAWTFILFDRIRVDPTATAGAGGSSALPVSEKKPYSPSFRYGSGYWGGSVMCV